MSAEWNKHEQLEAKRGPGGRFLPGVPGGPGGNTISQRRAHWRNAITEKTSDEDFDEIWKKLVTLAKEGEQWAVKEFFDRTLGKATAIVELQGEAALSLVKIIRGVDPDKL